MEQLCLECGKRIACKTFGVYAMCGTKTCILKRMLTFGFGCGSINSVRLSLCTECATEKTILAELYRVRAKHIRNNPNTLKPGVMWHPSGKAPLYNPKKLIPLTEVCEMGVPLREALLHVGVCRAYYDTDTGMFVAQFNEQLEGTIKYGITTNLSTWKLLLCG